MAEITHLLACQCVVGASVCEKKRRYVFHLSHPARTGMPKITKQRPHHTRTAHCKAKAVCIIGLRLCRRLFKLAAIHYALCIAEPSPHIQNRIVHMKPRQRAYQGAAVEKVERPKVVAPNPRTRMSRSSDSWSLVGFKDQTLDPLLPVSVLAREPASPAKVPIATCGLPAVHVLSPPLQSCMHRNYESRPFHRVSPGHLCGSSSQSLFLHHDAAENWDGCH